MSKGLFITAIGTDIGKTYVSALIQKKLIENKIAAAYFKAAMSGSENINNSDMAYVKSISKSKQELKNMVSYSFKEALSPHLASKINKTCIDLSKIVKDFTYLCSNYDYVTMEGSGGIICPIRYDSTVIMLEDIIKALNLNVVLVTNAELGTINSTLLTTSYLKSKNISCKGIIINNYCKSVLHDDNVYMIEQLSKLPILAKIARNSNEINIEIEDLLKLYE